MTRPLGEDIEALVAGELSPEDAERVLARIATEPEAAAELDEALQMRGLGHELGASEGQLARRRRTRTIIGFATLAVAAAAALVLYLGRRDPKPDDLTDRVFASLAPHRQLEPRLTWPAVDRYRPYDPPRAATTKPEMLSFELLAEVEKAGDARALPAAQLLTGNIDAATAALDKAADSADTLADRAAVALVRHDAERALVAAAAALDKTPTHPQARWNRALALQALGLDRSAAAAFDDIAAAHEPGWSDEAKTQAAALHAQRKRRDEAWAKAQELGGAMVAGGSIPMDQVAAFPGLMRLYFYDAMRSAGSAARVKELLPLADALDAAFGGTVLHDYATRIAAASFDKRAPLAARFAKIASTGGDDVKPLIRDARAAHQDDILLGALYWAGPGGELDAADVAEVRKLTATANDPWLQVVALENIARVDLARGEDSTAESELRAATASCETGPMVYRCMRLWRHIVAIDQVMHRTADAADALARARKDAAAAGSVSLGDELLVFASWQAALRDDTTQFWLPVARAYLDEADRSNLPCTMTMLARDAVTQALAGQYRKDDARRFDQAGRACDTPLTPQHAFTLAWIAGASEIPALRKQIEALRDSETDAGRRAFLDYLDGLVTEKVDAAAGRALFERASKVQSDEPDAVRARSYSYGRMIDAAGKLHAWADALALLAREHHIAVPSRCVVGAAEDDGSVFVAIASDGKPIGAYLERTVGERLGARAVPTELIRALDGCDAVDVLARAPYYGRSGLLPGTLAWRFRSTTDPAPGPVQPVVVVANVDPPAALHLSPLKAVEAPAGATMIEGAAATPSHVLDAMRTAGFVELDTHGIGDVIDDAALLALSPDANGDYGLTAPRIAHTRLVAHPVVVLAACGAGTTGNAYLGAHGLAEAFLTAGARAVIASPEPIPDAAASRVFVGIRTRIAAGAPPARALADERNAWTDPTQRAWIDHLVVFQ